MSDSRFSIRVCAWKNPNCCLVLDGTNSEENAKFCHAHEEERKRLLCNKEALTQLPPPDRCSSRYDKKICLWIIDENGSICNKEKTLENTDSFISYGTLKCFTLYCREHQRLAERARDRKFYGMTFWRCRCDAAKARLLSLFRRGKRRLLYMIQPQLTTEELSNHEEEEEDPDEDIEIVPEPPAEVSEHSGSDLTYEDLLVLVKENMTLTPSDLQDIYEKQDRRCFSCHRPIVDEAKHPMTASVDRLRPDILRYSLDNVVLSCLSCQFGRSSSEIGVLRQAAKLFLQHTLQPVEDTAEEDICRRDAEVFDRVQRKSKKDCGYFSSLAGRCNDNRLRNGGLTRRKARRDHAINNPQLYPENFIEKLDSSPIVPQVRESIAVFEGTRCLSRQDLINLWVAQKGRCAYTDVPFLPGQHPLFLPSVDRQNPSLGYAVKDNVHLVLRMVNYAKLGARENMENLHDWILALAHSPVHPPFRPLPPEPVPIFPSSDAITATSPKDKKKQVFIGTRLWLRHLTKLRTKIRKSLLCRYEEAELRLSITHQALDAQFEKQFRSCFFCHRALSDCSTDINRASFTCLEPSTHEITIDQIALCCKQCAVCRQKNHLEDFQAAVSVLRQYFASVENAIPTFNLRQMEAHAAQWSKTHSIVKNNLNIFPFSRIAQSFHEKEDKEPEKQKRRNRCRQKSAALPDRMKKAPLTRIGDTVSNSVPASTKTQRLNSDEVKAIFLKQRGRCILSNCPFGSQATLGFASILRIKETPLIVRFINFGYKHSIKKAERILPPNWNNLLRWLAALALSPSFGPAPPLSEELITRTVNRHVSVLYWQSQLDAALKDCDPRINYTVTIGEIMALFCKQNQQCAICASNLSVPPFNETSPSQPFLNSKLNVTLNSDNILITCFQCKQNTVSRSSSVCFQKFTSSRRQTVRDSQNE